MATTDRSPTLAQVVETLSFGWAQVRMCILGGGVYAADGAELLLIGSVTRAVSNEWKLNAMERGLIVSMVFFGVFLGNLLSGRIGDVHGRRLAVNLSYVSIVIFSVTSTLASGFYSMSLMRLFVGISFGIGQPAFNAMSGEMSPSHKRLHVTSAAFCAFTFGEIYSGALVYWSDPRMKVLDWRWLICMGALPSAFLGILSYMFLLESPAYLAVQDRTEEATEVLQKMRIQNKQPESTPLEFHFMPQSKACEQGTCDKLRNVLGPSMLFTTIVTSFSCFNLNFLFYGGLYAFPQLLPDIDTGLSPALSLIIGAFMEIPGYVFGLVVGINLSRKLGIQCFLLGAFVSSLMFAVAATHALAIKGRIPTWLELLMQIGLYGNKAFTSVGFLIVYCYSTEIYISSARVTGTAICVAMGRLGSITCPVIYEWLTDLTGTPITFIYLMAGICIMNSALVFLLTKETAGKLLKDQHDDEEDGERIPFAPKENTTSPPGTY